MPIGKEDWKAMTLARAAKFILKNPDATPQLDWADLSGEDLHVGRAIMDWAHGYDPLDDFFIKFEPYILTERAKDIAKLYLKNLREFLVEEGLATVPVTENYVGELHKTWSSIVTLHKRQEVHGYFGGSTLLTFTDPQGRIVKTFSKHPNVHNLVLGKQYKLTGFVSKHHVYKGSKETIVSKVVLDDEVGNVV